MSATDRQVVGCPLADSEVAFTESMRSCAAMVRRAEAGSGMRLESVSPPRSNLWPTGLADSEPRVQATKPHGGTRNGGQPRDNGPLLSHGPTRRHTERGPATEHGRFSATEPHGGTRNGASHGTTDLFSATEPHGGTRNGAGHETRTSSSATDHTEAHGTGASPETRTLLSHGTTRRHMERASPGATRVLRDRSQRPIVTDSCSRAGLTGKRPPQAQRAIAARRRSSVTAVPFQEERHASR